RSGGRSFRRPVRSLALERVPAPSGVHRGAPHLCAEYLGKLLDGFGGLGLSQPRCPVIRSLEHRELIVLHWSGFCRPARAAADDTQHLNLPQSGARNKNALILKRGVWWNHIEAMRLGEHQIVAQNALGRVAVPESQTNP